MSLLQKTIRADVQATSAYVVAPSAGMLKLDAMENPQGMPEVLLDELAQKLKEAELNRYPAPRALASCRVVSGVGTTTSEKVVSSTDEPS